MIYKVLLTVCVVAGGSWLFDRSADYLIKKDVKVKVNYAATPGINADILVHGACEPFSMINPEIIDSLTGLNTYNLAEDDIDFGDIYLSLYLYLKNQQAPKFLFLYAGPVEFDKSVTSNFLTFNFVPFLDDSVVYNTVKEHDPDFIRYTFIPYLRFSYYNNFTLSKVVESGGSLLLNHKLKPALPKGYFPVITSANSFTNFKVTNTPHNGHLNWFPIREKYFRKILALANQHHIETIVYQSPEYYDTACPILNLEEIRGKIRGITQEYNTRYWLLDTLPMSKDKSNFITTVNTTHKGATIFSNILGGMIVDSLLQPKMMNQITGTE